MFRKNASTGTVLLGVLLAGSGCAKTDGTEGRVTDRPIPLAAPSGKDASSDDQSARVLHDEPWEKTAGGFRFTIPPGWIENRPSSDFIQAEFTIPGPAGDSRLTLSSAGGTVDENIDRWINQFHLAPGDAPEIDDLEIDGIAAQFVDVRGTYRGGFGADAGSRAGWRLLGVVIPLGARSYFLKLTGPRQSVAETYEPFRELAKTARLER